MEIGNRLKAVANLVPKNKKIADILDITYGQSFNLLNEDKIESTN